MNINPDGLKLAHGQSLKNEKIIYFGDPMCSWCWGIANHLDDLKKHFAGKIGYEIVMGGLRPGGGDSWNSEMKAFLKEHWVHVNEASGQPFNYGLLDWQAFNYDTEPPSRAVVVVRDLKPESEFAFFKDVQYTFYVENNDPNEIGFYKPICEKFAIPFQQFSELFQSNEYREKVKQDFLKSRQYGIRGFPSVIFQNDEKAYLITSGYTTFESMVEAINKLTKQ